jgi:hypothetical protein
MVIKMKQIKCLYYRRHPLWSSMMMDAPPRQCRGLVDGGQCASLTMTRID